MPRESPHIGTHGYVQFNLLKFNASDDEAIAHSRLDHVLRVDLKMWHLFGLFEQVWYPTKANFPTSHLEVVTGESDDRASTSKTPSNNFRKVYALNFL